MSKLKLAGLQDDTPIKLTLEFPAQVHRDLSAYAALLSKEEGGKTVDPSRLVVPMLTRFMATDRVFAKLQSDSKAAQSS